MPADINHLYVITGGPGSGKSTLIDTQKRAGYHTSEEVGRQIIKDQVAIGGRAVCRGPIPIFLLR